MKKTIGILGGMGPEASSNLYKKMIKYCQDKYGAVQDSDYPPIVIYSLPLLGFDETGIVDDMLVKEQLIKGVQKLEEIGCDLIIIGCNTVHIFYSDLQSAVKIPILNIIDETKKKVIKIGYKKVGLFASESTTKTKLYQEKFNKENISMIQPNEEQQKILNKIIENVMGGNQKTDDVIDLKNIADCFLKKGAEAIVIGCTEIPLVINQSQIDVKLFDTTEIIVKAAVDFSLKI
jgi:aspartate racemase|tara:strand:+ start:3263 stop:3961 length:699 start_codon:yes stop_codon:yes gene_type:complete